MIAVILLGFGSPEKLADVGSFVENVAGRSLPPDRVAASIRKYSLIGGVSPFCATARAQAKLLETALSTAGSDIRVYLGMRFWEPSVDAAVADALDDAPERIILLCLTPFYSGASAGEYLRAAEEALSTRGNQAPVVRIEQWNEEPALIAGFAERLTEAVAEGPTDAPVLFTAHSLPQDMIDSGDPYAAQVRRTAELTAAVAGVTDWQLGWQSEGHGRGAWLKPTAEDILGNWRVAGRQAALIMPVGFTADHLETLYDIDIVMKEQAKGLGLTFARAKCLNEAKPLIAAMTAAVGRNLQTEVG